MMKGIIGGLMFLWVVYFVLVYITFTDDLIVVEVLTAIWTAIIVLNLVRGFLARRNHPGKPHHTTRHYF